MVRPFIYNTHFMHATKSACGYASWDENSWSLRVKKKDLQGKRMAIRLTTKIGQVNPSQKLV